MKTRTILFASAAIFMGINSAESQAAVFNFELSGSKNAVFSINTDQVPSFLSSSIFGDQISFNNIAGTFSGAAGTGSVGFGTGLFATLNVGGTALGFAQFAGPALFSLVNSKPSFNVGTFNLTSLVSGSSTIRVSQATAAVPEPATWAMMVGGLALIGSSMRRRKAIVSFA